MSKSITITIDEAWQIRRLIEAMYRELQYDRNRHLLDRYGMEIIECHNNLESKMIKQLKGEIKSWE